MILFENEIWFPEAFDKATGKMLLTDTNGKTIRIVDFEGEDTGADGVFASDNGKYIATIQPEFPKISGSTLNSGSTLTPKKL